MDFITTFFPPSRKNNSAPPPSTHQTQPKPIYPMTPYQQFAIPLKVVLNNYRTPIPPIMKQCIAFLSNESTARTEYLFRKSPPLARMQLMQEIANKGHHVTLEDPHEAAALIKLFLREMTDPLLPTALFPQIMAFSAIEKEETKMLATITIMDGVPREHKPLLWQLFRLLGQLSLYQESTKMGCTELGNMVGPTLCWAYDSVYMKPADMLALARFAQYLIEHSQQFFKHEPPNEKDGAPSTVINRQPVHHHRQRSVGAGADAATVGDEDDTPDQEVEVGSMSLQP